MSKQNKALSFRNFWPEGTKGGVTQSVKNKKGKGSYNRKTKIRATS